MQDKVWRKDPDKEWHKDPDKESTQKIARVVCWVASVGRSSGATKQTSKSSSSTSPNQQSHFKHRACDRNSFVELAFSGEISVWSINLIGIDPRVFAIWADALELIGVVLQMGPGAPKRLLSGKFNEHDVDLIQWWSNPPINYSKSNLRYRTVYSPGKGQHIHWLEIQTNFLAISQ